MSKKIDTKILIKSAEQYIIFGKFKKAESLLRKTVKQEYLNPEAHYLLGEALCKQEEFEEAISELEKADALLPNNPQIQHLLGWTIHMNGDSDKGRRLLIKALKAAPDNVSILCDLAVLELTQENDEKALKYATEAIKINPTDPMAQDVLQNVIRFSKLRELAKKKRTIN